jgi:hypothetical protein
VTERQLRIYTIEDGHLDEFIAAWTAGVLPLRRRFGFDVEAWVARDQNQVIWLVGYHGPGSFADADAAYYASPERAAVDPDPAQWIAINETRRVVRIAPVDQ